MSEKKVIKKGKKALRVEKPLPVEVEESDEEKGPLRLEDFLVKDSYQRVKLLSGQTISVKPWRLKEEKDFLFAIETKPDDEELLIDECLNLSKRCVDPNDRTLFNTLTKNEILHTLMHQRKLARGRVIDITFRCINEKCKDWVSYNETEQKQYGRIGVANTVQEDKISVDDHIKIEPQKEEPIEIGKFTFHTKELPYTAYRRLERKYLKNEQLGLNKFTYSLVKDSIHRIEVDGNPIVFNPSILESFVDQMTKEAYDLLAGRVYDNMSVFEVEKNVKCRFCGNEVPIVYDEMFDILVF